MTFELDLESYDITAQRGFLPGEDPLLRLPGYFSPWEEAGQDLPKRLMSGSVRPWLAKLPRLQTEGLVDRQSLDRAMLLLSYFGSAWVWGETSVNNRIPANIAS